ncbi:MAG: hypothetical protein ACC613_01270 [Synergistales bacterium]
MNGPTFVRSRKPGKEGHHLPDQARTAIHEAGHACYALVHRIRFRRVCIQKEEDEWSGALIFSDRKTGEKHKGRLEKKAYVRDLEIAEHFSGETGLAAEMTREIYMTLAGMDVAGVFAEFLLAGIDGNQPLEKALSGPDKKSFFKWAGLAIQAGMTSEGVAKELREIFNELDRYRGFISDLADMLIRKNLVPYGECRSLFERTKERLMADAACG